MKTQNAKIPQINGTHFKVAFDGRLITKIEFTTQPGKANSFTDDLFCLQDDYQLNLVFTSQWWSEAHRFNPVDSTQKRRDVSDRRTGAKSPDKQLLRSDYPSNRL